MLLNRRRVRCAALSRSCSTGSYTSGVRLAEAILSVATEGNTDLEDLKNRVIVELAKTTGPSEMRE